MMKKGRKKKNPQKSMSQLNQSSNNSFRYSRPFQSLWPVSQTLELRLYDALNDPYANYYFASQSLTKHCKQLQQTTKNSTKSQSNSQLCKSLRNKKNQIKNSIKKMQKQNLNIKFDQNLKVYPYTKNLKKSSKVSLQQFSQRLNIQQMQRQNEHKKLMNDNTTANRVQTPKIRLIKTLQPIQSQVNNYCVNIHQDSNCIVLHYRPSRNQSLNIKKHR